MVGIILAVLYVAYQLIFGNGQMSTEDAFLNASHFLFWWYVVVSAIIGVIVAVFFFLILVGSTAKGAEGGGAAGAVGGFLLGGGLSILLLVVVAIRIAIFVGGAYLLMTSGEYGTTWSDFNVTKMVVGGILLLVGILTRSHSSSQKSGE